MSHRPEQINRELLRGLSQIIHDELPLEHYGLITLTEVNVGPGYESARVYFTTLKKNDEITEDLLNKKAGWMRKMLEKKVMLRRIPQLIFTYDKRAERYEKIEQLLEEEEKKQAE